MKKVSFIVFLLLIVFTLSSCKRNGQTIDYLSPLERNQQGFLDADTYQVIGLGKPFDTEKLAGLRKVLFPADLQLDWTTEKILDYNSQDLRKEKTFLLKEIYSEDLKGLYKVKIPLEKLDPDLNLLIEWRKHLNDNACLAALYNALSVWVTMHETHVVSLVDDRMGKNSYDFFASDIKAGISGREDRIIRAKEKYEVIEERMLPQVEEEDGVETCQIVVHIRQDGLMKKNPWLTNGRK